MTFNDITRRRLAEEQLRQAQKLEAIGQLAAGIAHDFNNILTVITTIAECLKEDLEAGCAQVADVEAIQQAAQRAASLTRQLLAFSRKEVTAPRRLDLNDVLGDLETMLRRLIGEDVDLTMVKGCHLGLVLIDPGHLQQVIMNLAVNARDAMPRGGKLTIETSSVVLDEAAARAHLGLAAGAYVVLAVSDTGVGMDAATRARIFEPFFTTKEPGKGTGLGLATVCGIVGQAGGGVWAYSEPGMGSTFKVYLPRVDDGGEPHGQSAAGATPGGWETILVVEDEVSVRAAVARALRQRGYRVLEAGHGAEALQVARGYAEALHLLVTDVVLPEMSGRQVVEAMRDVHPEARVLYLSGYTNEAVVRHGVLQEGLAFLQKPFTPRDLAQKVREALDEGGTST